MGPFHPDIVERLISKTAPKDAVASYYAWSHPGSRLHVRRHGEDDGVLVEAESADGPIGILRASGPSVVPDVLADLPPGRRYLMAPWALEEALRRTHEVREPERNRTFHIRAGSLRTPEAPAGRIHRGEGCVLVTVGRSVASTCWVLWRSPNFAEIAVTTGPEFRGKGLAKTVVSEMAGRLLRSGRTPIYVAGVDNVPSLRLAERLGFSQSAAEEFAGYVEVTP